MSCARPLAYGLGLSQAFLMMGVVLLYPAARVQSFAFAPCVINGTLASGALCGSLRVLRVDVSVLCLLASAAATAFVSSSLSLSERGQLQEECSYCREAVDALGFWDTLFWLTVAATHAAVVLLATSPGDVCLCGGATYLMVGSLYSLCRPKDAEGAPSEAMRVTANLLGYVGGLAVAVAGVPDGYSQRYCLLLLLAVLDYLLGVGHAWDRAPLMETVTTCRVFFACAAGLYLAGAYAAWHEGLRLPSVLASDA